MSLAQRVHFLQYVFQMSAISLVSVINHYHIDGLHLFWNTQYKVRNTPELFQKYSDHINQPIKTVAYIRNGEVHGRSYDKLINKKMTLLTVFGTLTASPADRQDLNLKKWGCPAYDSKLHLIVMRLYWVE